MSDESSPNQPNTRKTFSDSEILFFIVALCVICGFLLAAVSFSLQSAQVEAKEFDESKQMLIAAKILTHQGSFQIISAKGELIPAQFDANTKTLVPLEKGHPVSIATDEQIKAIADLRIRPLLTDQEGNIFTLQEKNITLPEYLASNKKAGYANLPLKLFYAILPNTEKAEQLTPEELSKNIEVAELFVIPVSGFGLWAPIYGFIAIADNGNEVIGATWYEHAETPGLGANIAEAWWQKQFYGKDIFQKSPSGKTDFETASMGIVVVKGKVQDVYGSSPKAASAVDGMSGATLTGDGVTQAYRNSLTPYREFFIKVHEMHKKDSNEQNGKLGK